MPRHQEPISHTQLTKLVFELLRDLDGFSYSLSVSDRVWDIICPGEAKKWYHLRVSNYMGTFFISHMNGDCATLEARPSDGSCAVTSTSYANHRRKLSPAEWLPLIISSLKWLHVVRKDWIKANRIVQEHYPLSFRYGVAPHAVIRASLPDIYRLDKELEADMLQEFERLVEDGFFRKPEHTEVTTMTAADYFNYCRIAYIAGKRVDETVDVSLSGREMYARYADGRHEGLLDIAPDSEQEFADWIDGKHPKRTLGGHPWEIKRGGNTSHIDLCVSRPSPYLKEGFKVELRAEATSRMAETVRMLLAIYKEGLTISINHPEAVRKRLLAQDNIGIIPAYASLHRANQHFQAADDVIDVLYYADLGRFKRRITPFITWEPLPLLKPKDV